MSKSTPLAQLGTLKSTPLAQLGTLKSTPLAQLGTLGIIVKTCFALILKLYTRLPIFTFFSFMKVFLCALVCVLLYAASFT